MIDELLLKGPAMLTRLREQFSNALRQFDEDEDGLETLQVVMIIAVAAVVLILVTSVLFPQVKDWVVEQVGKLTGFSG